MADWNTPTNVATIANSANNNASMNAMNVGTMGSETIAVQTDREAAALSANSNEKTITQRWKAPARSVSVNVSATPWKQLDLEIPEQYRALVGAVLESAAKSILKRHIEAYSSLPSTLPAKIFTMDALLTEAAEGNSDWMTKEELQTAWEQSATRKQFINNPNYAQSAGYRKAVSYYSDLLLKLAGKTSSYKPEELDIILAKMNEQDQHTDLGAFVCRRVEQLRSKPQKTNDVDLDLL
jgi:hypothetical protein